jgi:hypothetical protein
MSTNNAISYNRRSSQIHGWTPDWFNSNGFNSSLIDKIKIFQKSYNLAEDGLVGPETFRVLLSARNNDKSQYIICGGKRVPIDWQKVVCFDEPGSFTLPGKSIIKSPGRKPNMFVIHWDACLNSSTCVRVLQERNLSVHFCIDNDGTIYQLVDCDDIAQHAAGVNSKSIGVEVSNAFYTKFQSWYEKNGFGKREILKDIPVHNSVIKECLDFYPIQKQAISVLLKTVCNHYSIPLDTPDSITEVPSVASGTYKGVVSHLHVTKNKIDCAGLDIKNLLK